MAKFTEEIGKLKKAVDRRAQSEMARVLAAYWHGDAGKMRHAQQVVDTARKEMHTLLARAEDVPPSPDMVEAQDSIAEFACVSVRTMLTSKSNIDNLLLKSQSSRKALDRTAQDMHDISKTVDELVRKGLIGKVYKETKAATGLIETLATRAMNFQEAALDFANGSWSLFDSYDSSSIFDIFGDLSTTVDDIKGVPRKVANKIFAKLKAMSPEKLAKYKKWFGAANKILLGVGVAIWVTTTVFEAFSDSGNWGYHVSEALVTMGASLAIGAVITGTAVASAITSAIGVFSGAAATVEVPPLAAALAAAGIVILAGVAVAKIFQSMVNLIFGGMNTRHSMSITLSRGMVTSLNKSMSKKMSKSLWPD